MTKLFVIVMAFLCIVLPEISAAGSFKDNGNGTVTDSKTLLMWQQGEGDEMKWNAAIAYCKKLSLAGYNDWRLPKIKELESIVVYGGGKFAMNKANFPDAHDASYWSSSPYYIDTAFALDVELGAYSRDRTHSFYVRCVRGGE